MPREMTEEEKVFFRSLFPSLIVEGEIVTGEADERYNCIAWTLRVTDRWVWPGGQKTNFDALYAQYGYLPNDNGSIAIFGEIENGFIGSVKHGSVIYINGLFESKCGRYLRISHLLNGISNGFYGNVVGYYSKDKKADMPPLIKLTWAEQREIRLRILKVPKIQREQFNRLFAAWQKTWSSQQQEFLSDPYSRAQGDEFKQLVELGPDSIPLVIEALAEPDNFFAICLYERLQQDLRLHVKIRPDSPEVLQGEQSRAVRIIRKWLEQ